MAREDANNITSFERVASDKIFEFSAIRIQELPMIAMFAYQIKWKWRNIVEDITYIISTKLSIIFT